MRKLVILTIVALFAFLISIPTAGADAAGAIIGVVVGVPLVTVQPTSPITGGIEVIDPSPADLTDKAIFKPIELPTVSLITDDEYDGEGVIGEAWTDLDGDGINDNGEDECVGYNDLEEDDSDGDGIVDPCDVCIDDPDPDHQELDDCVVPDDGGDDDGEVIEDVEDGDEELDLDGEAEMNYFDLDEEGFNDAMNANAEGAGCSVVPGAPANAFMLLLISAAFVPVAIRRRK